MQKMIIGAFLLSSIFASNAMERMETKTYCCKTVSSVPVCQECYNARQKEAKYQEVRTPQAPTQQPAPVRKLTASQELHRCP